MTVLGFCLLGLYILWPSLGHCFDDDLALSPSSSRILGRLPTRTPPLQIPLLLTASIDGRITALKPDTGSVQWYDYFVLNESTEQCHLYILLCGLVTIAVICLVEKEHYHSTTCAFQTNVLECRVNPSGMTSHPSCLLGALTSEENPSHHGKTRPFSRLLFTARRSLSSALFSLATISQIAHGANGAMGAGECHHPQHRRKPLPLRRT
jgi:hypothetical protein